MMMSEQQYGFVALQMFTLRVLIENYRDHQKELHCVFEAVVLHEEDMSGREVCEAGGTFTRTTRQS